MPVFVLQRKHAGESLGLDVGRCVGGKLTIDTVLAGSVAERAGVPCGHTLLRVAETRVWNVSTLQEAVLQVKVLMSFEIEVSDVCDVKAAVAVRKLNKKRRRSTSPVSEASESSLSPLLPLKWMDEFNPRSAATPPYAPPAIPCC